MADCFRQIGTPIASALPPVRSNSAEIKIRSDCGILRFAGGGESIVGAAPAIPGSLPHPPRESALRLRRTLSAAGVLHLQGGVSCPRLRQRFRATVRPPPL